MVGQFPSYRDVNSPVPVRPSIDQNLHSSSVFVSHNLGSQTIDLLLQSFASILSVNANLSIKLIVQTI